MYISNLCLADWRSIPPGLCGFGLLCYSLLFYVVFSRSFVVLLLFFRALCRSLLFFVVLCSSLLFFAVLCCSMWFFVVLCCSLLFFVALCISLLLLLLLLLFVFLCCCCCCCCWCWCWYWCWCWCWCWCWWRQRLQPRVTYKDLSCFVRLATWFDILSLNLYIFVFFSFFPFVVETPPRHNNHGAAVFVCRPWGTNKTTTKQY